MKNLLKNWEIWKILPIFKPIIKLSLREKKELPLFELLNQLSLKAENNDLCASFNEFFSPSALRRLRNLKFDDDQPMMLRKLKKTIGLVSAKHDSYCKRGQISHF